MNDGGPAFPQQSGVGAGGRYKFDTAGGMSLRDYFAAAAISGRANVYPISELPEIAESAYVLADAMLAEREKKTP